MSEYNGGLLRTKLPFLMRALLLVGALTVSSMPAAATIITGELNIIGGVRVDADDIDFLPLGGGTGVFLADPFTQEGSFVPYAGTTGVVKDLNPGNSAVGIPFTLADFITLDAWPGFTMTLELIRPGVFSSANCGAAPAAGQTCTPFAGSPFNLNNLTAGSSAASFSVAGVATDGSGDPVSRFTGTFTTQFSDQSFQDVLAIINGGGSVDAAFSANFVFNPVPEPSTIGMVLLGAVATIAGARRRRA